MQDKEVSVVRTATPKIDVNNNMVDVKFAIWVKDLATRKINKLFESHPMRHFSIPEIGLLAKLTGFEVLEVEEFLTGKEPSGKTWGVCFILKKI